jgi:hypothetical protein
MKNNVLGNIRNAKPANTSATNFTSMRVLTPRSFRSRELLVGSLTSPSYGSTALIGYERAFLALKHRLTTVTFDSSQRESERYAADRRLPPRWEKAGLLAGCDTLPMFDVLEAQRKRRPAMQKISTMQTRGKNIF